MSLPATIDEQAIDKLPGYSRILVNLTTIQRQVLFALVVNMVSEHRKTELEIAQELGIDQKTVYLCRQNSNFAYALSCLVTDAIKGTIDIAVGNLMQLTDNVKAQEILLRIAEVYNPTQRILALSGKLDAKFAENVSSPGGIIRQFVTKFAELGYSKSRLHEEIDAIWDDLKAEGSI